MTAAAGGWTVETVRDHLESVIALHDRRYEQRFADQQQAVEAALSAAKEAVIKAETAAEKRFEVFGPTLGGKNRLTHKARYFIGIKPSDAAPATMEITNNVRVAGAGESHKLGAVALRATRRSATEERHMGKAPRRISGRTTRNWWHQQELGACIQSLTGPFPINRGAQSELCRHQEILA